MSSSRPRQTSYLMKSTTDRGGRPFRGGEKAVSGPIKWVKTREVMVGIAYGQNMFDNNASNIFVATKDSVVAKEPLVYPWVDVITRPLSCFFYQEDFEPNLS